MDRLGDEKLIRLTEAAYDDAWCKGDVEGLLACLKDDAFIISPRNDLASGKEEIRKLFTELFSSDAKNTKHISRINRINFVTDDVAVVDGEAFIDGSGIFLPQDAHHRFTDILVRSGNDWLISQIRACRMN